MLYPRKYVIRFVSDFVRPVRPDLEAPLLAVLDSLEAGTSPEPDVLDGLVEVASSTSSALYDLGTTMLGELAERDTAALEAVVQMAASAKSRTRHNALLCLTDKTPAEACIEIIQNALTDKSSLVRGKAADWAGRLRLQAVLPCLCKAESVEQHRKTREVMFHELRLLRDGYLIEPAGEHESSITVHAAGGRISKIVRNDRIERDGIALVVAVMSGNDRADSTLKLTNPV